MTSFRSRLGRLSAQEVTYSQPVTKGWAPQGRSRRKPAEGAGFGRCKPALSGQKKPAFPGQKEPALARKKPASFRGAQRKEEAGESRRKPASFRPKAGSFWV